MTTPNNPVQFRTVAVKDDSACTFCGHEVWRTLRADEACYAMAEARVFGQTVTCCGRCLVYMDTTDFYAGAPEEARVMMEYINTPHQDDKVNPLHVLDRRIAEADKEARWAKGKLAQLREIRSRGVSLPTVDDALRIYDAKHEGGA